MHGTTEGIQRENGRGMSILIRRPGSQAQEMHVARIGNYGLGGKAESVDEERRGFALEEEMVAFKYQREFSDRKFYR